VHQEHGGVERLREQLVDHAVRHRQQPRLRVSI
jgi:hypothetical protein